MWQFVLMAALAGLLGSACGDDDDQAHDDEHGDHGHDSGHLDPDEEIKCPDTIPELFAGETTGSEATGMKSLVKARVIAADHLPPHKLLNTWTIELTDLQGEPLADAELVDFCTFMPVHGHGTGPLGDITPLDEPGRFEIEEMNFVMRGPWEVQLAVNPGGEAGETAEMARTPDCRNSEAGADFVMFDVCVVDD
jgi:hypothetical protein